MTPLLAAHGRVTALTLLPMDTTLSRLHAGQLLDGRYRVGSWIARGGMATVYLGTDTKLDRTVALKVAHAELAGDPEFVRRFIGEARSVARLSSPNVVAVYDQGADGGPAVPGHGVRARPDAARADARARPARARARRSTSSAGSWAAWPPRTRPASCTGTSSRRTCCSATATRSRSADFGLARAASRASHTKTGMIIGTAAYLAPEQVSRSTSDARTDVYAAGVMLFEMLTGAQPHTGDTPLAVAHKHVSDVVPAPSSVVPGLPPSLDTLVALATSRDPGPAAGDAGQFLRAISDVRRGLPIAAGLRRRRHAPGCGVPDAGCPVDQDGGRTPAGTARCPAAAADARPGARGSAEARRLRSGPGSGTAPAGRLRPQRRLGPEAGSAETSGYGPGSGYGPDGGYTRPARRAR